MDDTPVKRIISQDGFFAVLWASVAVLVFFVGCRLLIRWHVFQKLFWDDFFVTFALLCFIGSSSAEATQPEGLFIQYDIAVGAAPLTIENIQLLLDNFRIQLASLILSFCTLWFVKISFLIFFRRLGSRVRGQRIWCWCIMALVLTSFVSCFGLVPYKCLTSGLDLALLSKCAEPRAIVFYQNILRYQVGIDIVTDILIISIPVLMLWNVSIPLKQKLGLISLCSLTVFVIAFAGARVAVVNNQNTETPDMAWVLFWSNMECTIALIVACLGSFRQLFTSAAAIQPSRENPDSSSWTDLGSKWTGLFRSSKGSKTSRLNPFSFRSHERTESAEQLQPLKSIYVSYEVEIKHDDNPVDVPQRAHYSHQFSAGAGHSHSVSIGSLTK